MTAMTTRSTPSTLDALTPRRPPLPLRRGMGIAAIVIVLAGLNLAVVGAVRATADDAYVGSLRVETIRAFYAAESAARVAVRCVIDGDDYPAQGSSLNIGNATARFIQIPASGSTGDVVVLGRSGNATRRLSITIQDAE